MMKKSVFRYLFALMIVMTAVACNHSGAQQSFSQFSMDVFAKAVDDNPQELENVNLIFDVDENESVFDQMIIDNEFSV